MVGRLQTQNRVFLFKKYSVYSLHFPSRREIGITLQNSLWARKNEGWR